MYTLTIYNQGIGNQSAVKNQFPVRNPSDIRTHTKWNQAEVKCRTELSTDIIQTWQISNSLNCIEQNIIRKRALYSGVKI